MNKGGISAVVAMVLLILITVAAVAIIWVAIIPLFTFDFTNAEIYVGDDGYTSYDVVQNIASVQVERGVDEAELVGLDFVFYVDGNSFTYHSDKFPGLNSEDVYYFSFCKYGIAGIPEAVSVVPIHKGGLKNVVGYASPEVKIRVGSFVVEKDDYLDLFSNYLKEEGKPVDFPAVDNIVSYWSFDRDVSDVYGVNDGVLYGAGTSFESGVMGSCKGIDFGDVGSYVLVNESLDNGMNQDEGAVAVWFKRNDYNNETLLGASHNYIFSMFNWTDGPANRLYIDFKPSSDVLEVAKGSYPCNPPIYNSWNDVRDISLNEWHFVTLTWRADSFGALGGNYSVYIDGVLDSSFRFENYTLTNQIHWGAWADHPGYDSHAASFYQPDPDLEDEYFNGVIDEGIIFDKELNDSEVYDLFLVFNDTRM